MPHPRDWQGGQMPRCSRGCGGGGGLGAAGSDWCISLKVEIKFLNKLNLINTDSTARPAPLNRLKVHVYVRKSFFDRTKICVRYKSLTKFEFQDFLCLMVSLRSKPAFLPPRNDQQLLSLGYSYKDLLLLNHNKVMFK